LREHRRRSPSRSPRSWVSLRGDPGEVGGHEVARSAPPPAARRRPVSLIPAVRAAAWQAAGKLKGFAAPLLGPPSAAASRRRRGLHGGGKSVPCEERLREAPGDVPPRPRETARRTTDAPTRASSASQFAEVVRRRRDGPQSGSSGSSPSTTAAPGLEDRASESQIKGGVLQGIRLRPLRGADRRPEERGASSTRTWSSTRSIGSKDVPEVVPILLDVYTGGNNTHTAGVASPPRSRRRPARSSTRSPRDRRPDHPDPGHAPARVLAAAASHRKEVTAREELRENPSRRTGNDAVAALDAGPEGEDRREAKGGAGPTSSTG